MVAVVESVKFTAAFGYGLGTKAALYQLSR
jgi:hypothetical protein